MHDLRLEYARLILPILATIGGIIIVIRQPESQVGSGILVAAVTGYYALSQTQAQTRVDKADNVNVSNTSSGSSTDIPPEN